MKKRRTLVVKKPNSNKERVPSTRNFFNNNHSSHLLKDDSNGYVHHKMMSSISKESIEEMCFDQEHQGSNIEVIPRFINIEEATRLVASRHLYTTSSYIHTLNDAWAKKNEKLIEVRKLIHLSMSRIVLDSKNIMDVIRKIAKEKDMVEKIGQDTLQSIIDNPIRNSIFPYLCTSIDLSKYIFDSDYYFSYRLYYMNQSLIFYNLLNGYNGKGCQELKNIALDNMIETMTNQLRRDEKIHTKLITIEEMLNNDPSGFRPNTLYIGNKISGKYGYTGTGKTRYHLYQSLV